MESSRGMQPASVCTNVLPTQSPNHHLPNHPHTRVAGEAVEQPAGGRGIEEGGRQAQHGAQQAAVGGSGCHHAALGEGEGPNLRRGWCGGGCGVAWWVGGWGLGGLGRCQRGMASRASWAGQCGTLQVPQKVRIARWWASAPCASTVAHLCSTQHALSQTAHTLLIKEQPAAAPLAMQAATTNITHS